MNAKDHTQSKMKKTKSLDNHEALGGDGEGVEADDLHLGAVDEVDYALDIDVEKPVVVVERGVRSGGETRNTGSRLLRKHSYEQAIEGDGDMEGVSNVDPEQGTGRRYRHDTEYLPVRLLKQ